jgi:WD repeat and SOF domain-containing protein 1
LVVSGLDHTASHLRDISIPLSESNLCCRIPFDPSRNFPDLGARFEHGERVTRAKALAEKQLSSSKNKASSEKKSGDGYNSNGYVPHPQSREELEQELMRTMRLDQDDVADDERDLGWATVLKRTFEAYMRCERPNMYGEWIVRPFHP